MQFDEDEDEEDYIRTETIPWDRGSASQTETESLVRLYNAIICLRGMFDELCRHPDPLVFLENDRRTVLIGAWDFDPIHTEHALTSRYESQTVTNQGPLLKRLNNISWRNSTEFAMLRNGNIFTVVHPPPTPPPRPIPWRPTQQVLDFLGNPDMADSTKITHMLQYNANHGVGPEDGLMDDGSNAAGLSMSKRALLAATLMKKGATNAIGAAGNNARATTGLIRTGADSVRAAASAAKAKAAAVAKHGLDVLEGMQANESGGGMADGQEGSLMAHFTSINEGDEHRPMNRARSSSLRLGSSPSLINDSDVSMTRERRRSFREPFGGMMHLFNSDNSDNSDNAVNPSEEENGTQQDDDDKQLADTILGAQRAAYDEYRRGSITLDEYKQMQGVNNCLLNGDDNDDIVSATLRDEVEEGNRLINSVSTTSPTSTELPMPMPLRKTKSIQMLFEPVDNDEVSLETTSVMSSGKIVSLKSRDIDSDDGEVDSN